MWTPKTIKFTNLFAHKKSEYSFKNGKCTVIFGKNETDSGFDNNGSGKSTLYEAISIALTNDSLRNLNKEDFINSDEESCKIVFELENKHSKGKLKIVREFFRTKTTKIEIWENGVHNKQIVSNGEANKRIFELIGITKEDLLRYFIIAQDSRYTFFTANDVEKKEIMNRITSADMINPAVDELSKRFKTFKTLYDDKYLERGKLTSRIETLEEQKEELLLDDTTLEDIKVQKDKRILKVELKGEHQETLDELNKTISKKKSILSTKKFDEKLKTKLSSELKTLKEDIKSAKKVINTIESELEGVITCPHCEEDFILNSEYDLSIEDAKTLKSETQKLELTYEKQLPILESKIKLIDKAQEEKEELEREIKKLERNAVSAKDDIEFVDSEIEKIDKKIASLKQNKKDDKELKAIETKIKLATVELTEFDKELEVIQSDLEMVKFWQYNMGKSGFLTFLANKSIKIIEGKTNSFLKRFKVDMTILINGFKVLKGGDVREKIDVFVQQDGVTAKKFMSKSGGERGRIQLAGILAIQHLINLSTDGKGLDLLLLDEVFPGIDPLGQENIIKILEKLEITVLMITQTVSDGFNNENSLYVKKVGGESFYTDMPKLLN